MFLLARQRQSAGHMVVVTASTHLGAWQAAQADVHHILRCQPGDLRGILTNFQQDRLEPVVVAITGPVSEGSDEKTGRLTGLNTPDLEFLFEEAEKSGFDLLVEADGSRQRPLKAPASHEPAIPAWASQVMVCAGLAGLGRPLSPEWVHRPDLFSQVAGLEPGAEIALEAVRRVLLSPQGGLKGIPAAARRVALLNQADSDALQAAGGRLAQELLTGYHAALVSRLGGTQMAGGQVLAVYESVAGVLLAAGMSARLGQPKQLLEFQGEPLVRRVARLGLQAGLSPMIVVTGAYAAEVQRALEGMPVEFVHNPNWISGQGSSVSLGAQKLPAETGAAVFLLVDQPFVTQAVLRRLVEEHAASLGPVIAPLVNGQRANPVLFDRVTFSDLCSLSGEAGGRAIFSRYPPRWMEWNDAGLLLDIDTPGDLERMVQYAG